MLHLWQGLLSLKTLSVPAKCHQAICLKLLLVMTANELSIETYAI